MTDTTTKDHDVPVCDVLSYEEIAQAWYDASSWLPFPWPWNQMPPYLRKSLTNTVAELIRRKVIVAGRRA